MMVFVIIAVIIALYKMFPCKTENGKLKWELSRRYCYPIPIEQQDQETSPSIVVITVNSDHNK